MNIFSAINIYPGKWQETENRVFTQEELNAVKDAVVVDSQFGQSVCFHMMSGASAYIPLSNDCRKATGDSVDIKAARLITLSREGEGDIYRIKC